MQNINLGNLAYLVVLLIFIIVSSKGIFKSDLFRKEFFRNIVIYALIIAVISIIYMILFK